MTASQIDFQKPEHAGQQHAVPFRRMLPSGPRHTKPLTQMLAGLLQSPPPRVLQILVPSTSMPEHEPVLAKLHSGGTTCKTSARSCSRFYKFGARESRIENSDEEKGTETRLSGVPISTHRTNAIVSAEEHEAVFSFTATSCSVPGTLAREVQAVFYRK